jgi:integrase
VIRSPQLRAIVLTFLFTGLRISDVVRFPLDSLDLKNGRMILRTQKRGKIVSLALHPELRGALEVHLSYRTQAQQASPFIFSTAPGKPMLSLDADLRRVFKRCGIQHGHAHRFRDTFPVRLLAQGASLYDVSKMLGINMGTAERHYAPYVQELQDRSARLIASLKVPIPPDPEKVVQFCSPLSATHGNSGEGAAKVGEVQYPLPAKGKS